MAIRRRHPPVILRPGPAPEALSQSFARRFAPAGGKPGRDERVLEDLALRMAPRDPRQVGHPGPEKLGSLSGVAAGEGRDAAAEQRNHAALGQPALGRATLELPDAFI